MRKYIFFILVILCACEKQLPTQQDFPIIHTLSPTGIDETGATFNAVFDKNGKTGATSFGFVWDTKDPVVFLSHKVVVDSGANLGKVVNGGTFQKRIDHSLAKGKNYQIRAFAIYGGKVVYGNAVTFTSSGCKKGSWTLESSKIQLSESIYYSYGCSVGNNGYVLFPSSHFYKFDSVTKSFEEGNSFPVSGKYGMQFDAVSSNKDMYVFTNWNGNLYRLTKGQWTIQSNLRGLSFDPDLYGYYQGLFFSDTVYMFNTLGQSFKYATASDVWLGAPNVPGNPSTYSVAGASLKGKAYVMTSAKVFWEYNTATNRWTRKADFPGPFYEISLSFSSGNKIYLGLTRRRTTNISSGWMDKGLWSYDPQNDTWERKDDFPDDLPSGDIFWFTINNKLYLGHGHLTYKLWSFDPS